MKTYIQLAIYICFSYVAMAQTITNYTTEDGLLNNNVLCLAQHSNGSVWFGTQGGVSAFDGTVFTNYTKDVYTGMADNNTLSIYVNSKDEVWIGTDFGTSVFDGTSWKTYTSADGLGNNKVLFISEDANGVMWFGTNTGLSQYDGTNWTNYGTSEGLPFGGVNSIKEHNDGTLWLGTGLGGIAVFNGSEFEMITTTEGLISNKIRAIDFDSDDKAWVATADGLSLLDNDKSHITNYTRIYALPGSDTLNPIEDIKVGNDGVVWAGVYVDYLVTEGGVCGFNGSNWTEFDVESGMIGPVVRALDVDNNNDVWIATSSGVSVISDHYLNIKKATKESNFSIYPNPAVSELNVSINSSKNTEYKTIEVLNANMQTVLSTKFILATSLNIETLPTGLYFIKATTNNAIEYQQFIKN